MHSCSHIHRPSLWAAVIIRRPARKRPRQHQLHLRRTPNLQHKEKCNSHSRGTASALTKLFVTVHSVGLGMRQLTVIESSNSEVWGHSCSLCLALLRSCLTEFTYVFHLYYSDHWKGMNGENILPRYQRALSSKTKNKYQYSRVTRCSLFLPMGLSLMTLVQRGGWFGWNADNSTDKLREWKSD